MRASFAAILEVSLLFSGVIAVCKILDRFRDVPWVVRHELVALGAACLFLYVPLIVLQATRRDPQEFGITFRGLRTSLRIAGIFSVLFLPAFLLLYSQYRQLWVGVPLQFELSTQWPVLVAFHLLCVALPEEVFYRGYVQSRLNRVLPRRVRLFSATVGFGWLYTAFLFAFGHFLITHRPEGLATFLPGLLFGWMRERTGSIVAPTLFHALCNGVVLLVT